MKKHLSVSLLVLLGLFGFVGCDGDTSSVTPEKPNPEANLCDPDCTKGETCVEGVCQCGSEVCKADEVCESGKCVPKTEPCTGEHCGEPEPCTGDDCVPPVDACDGACSGDETCVEGVCKCGDEICGLDENCNSGTCEKVSSECTGDDCEPALDSCNGICSEAETCVDGVCKCGDNVCTDQQECKAGTCESKVEEPPYEEDPVCEPECKADERCEESGCVPIDVPPVECNPACNSESEYCDANGVCQKIEEESCNACSADETCVAGVCMCGKTTCNEDEYCKSGTCEPKDPCAKKTCASGEVCVEGSCKAIPISFKPTQLDVMLSSVSGKLVATNSDDSDLVWTVAGKAADKDMSGLRCWTKDKKVSKKPSECIIKNKSKKTETIQFVGFNRHLGTVKVTVENAAKAKAEATLTLKPYFDMNNFVKISGLVYRNGYAAGEKNNNYADTSETDTEKIANLGGEKTKYGDANPHGKQIFSNEEVDVIDHDMYINYVRPHMLKVDSQYYGTRASVVAAARFLILQFPYDIPYANGSGQYSKGRSHYVFTTKELQSKLAEVGIFGLNLNSNAYNSTTNHGDDHIIRKNVVPWGAAVDKQGNNDIKHPYNGLECSGFVTWALRNGLLGLGDWHTIMFGRDESCKIDGKIVRNYKCEEYVNKANPNNKLMSTYSKMKRLKDSDFKLLSKKTETELQTAFKEAKAGDLLWRGIYIDKTKDTYKNGHVAMIIGIKRNSKGVVTHIEVGEAIGRNGNMLSKYDSMAKFADSGWVNTKMASYLIKMDNVYNYYSDTKKITTASEKSDCPNNVKSGGNCYLYTDMYNEAFNDAIQIKN